MKTTVAIIKKGITAVHAEAVVNAANCRLRAGGGVCGAIFAAAGEQQLQQACDAIGACQTGSAVITPGFYLCRYIIHAVGPVYIDGDHRESQLLYSCYQKSLDLARSHNVHSIAFPLISSGIYGYPKPEAWEVAMQSVSDWIGRNQDHHLEITFAVLEDEVLKLGIETAERLGIELSNSY